jgi:hopene-associated glycosyltransferase HpnB
MIVGALFGFLPLAIWLYLLLARRGFWLLRERDTLPVSEPSQWPAVVAVVPARDEADVIQRSIGSLLAQDYPGEFRVVLVDDQSDDGTGDLARALNDRRLTVMTGRARPSGWTGKLWAMNQGAEAASAAAPEFLWFTDADIAHAPDTLRSLVARAEKDGRVLVSLMARLSCRTTAEHFLIPAFVFFFDMLFPFGAANDPNSRLAAAAGGCMLTRRAALEKAGGIEAIRHNIIDDCALARLMKRQGPIWLGLTDRSVSLRPYEHLSDIRRMVARSAYAQLGYSPLMLLFTLAGLFVVYIAPVMGALFAMYYVQLAAYLAWAIMALMFQPILRFYRLSPLWGIALPVIGAFYAAFTVDSAIQHWLGKGGMWKGRAQAGEQA